MQMVEVPRPQRRLAFTNCAVMFFGLDGFKLAKDTFGRAAGCDARENSISVSGAVRGGP